MESCLLCEYKLDPKMGNHPPDSTSNSLKTLFQYLSVDIVWSSSVESAVAEEVIASKICENCAIVATGFGLMEEALMDFLKLWIRKLASVSSRANNGSNKRPAELNSSSTTSIPFGDGLRAEILKKWELKLNRHNKSNDNNNEQHQHHRDEQENNTSSSATGNEGAAGLQGNWRPPNCSQGQGHNLDEAGQVGVSSSSNININAKLKLESRAGIHGQILEDGGEDEEDEEMDDSDTMDLNNGRDRDLNDVQEESDRSRDVRGAGGIQDEVQEEDDESEEDEVMVVSAPDCSSEQPPQPPLLLLPSTPSQRVSLKRELDDSTPVVVAVAVAGSPSPAPPPPPEEVHHVKTKQPNKQAKARIRQRISDQLDFDQNRETWMVDTSTKPRVTLIFLIQRAISHSPNKQLKATDIFSWIQSNVGYYRNEKYAKTLRSIIPSTLSRSDCFEPVDPLRVKDGAWKVNRKEFYKPERKWSSRSNSEATSSSSSCSTTTAHVKIEVLNGDSTFQQQQSSFGGNDKFATSSKGNGKDNVVPKRKGDGGGKITEKRSRSRQEPGSSGGGRGVPTADANFDESLASADLLAHVKQEKKAMPTAQN